MTDEEWLAKLRALVNEANQRSGGEIAETMPDGAREILEGWPVEEKGALNQISDH